ncbi:hypothetical protein OROGR_006760 [Orobanche gracilis]
MRIPENPNRNPGNPENPSEKIQPEINGNDQKRENLFSPRFRSVAAMAGWDEEALLTASLIVEDTPDRQLKHKKRSDLHSFKTPPTNSRRKRKSHRRSPESIPIAVLDLDEDESKLKQEVINSEKIDEKTKTTEEVVEKNRDSGVSIPGPAIPCLNLLREELSCAICLEICYEPSTTPCGHSFCKKCLRSAADRCGKRCPKCRQLISNSRYCTVNTVLWNTIQLLFPQEVEARKKNDDASSASDTQSKEGRTLGRSTYFSTRNRAVEATTLNSPETESTLIITGPERRNHRSRYGSSRPSGIPSSRQGIMVVPPSQDEDAAFALRLQREEFMEAFRVPDERSRDSFAAARANLRAMASQAINIRVRGQRRW